MQKKILYRCTSTVSALNHYSRIFSKPSVIYTKWCAQTFAPIFWIFAIFHRNFANIVAPPSDENANYVMRLIEQSLLKKSLKPATKSYKKRQRKSCSNYAPLERTVIRTWSVTNKKKTPHFCIYSRLALCDLPQTLQGDRARRAHHKRCHSFFDPTHSFSYRVHGKNWPNLPARGFSAITP